MAWLLHMVGSICPGLHCWTGAVGECSGHPAPTVQTVKLDRFAWRATGSHPYDVDISGMPGTSVAPNKSYFHKLGGGN